MGPIERVLHEKLTGFLAPSYLELTNESAQHGLPPGTEKHFRVVAVSEQFDGASRIERHRLVHQLLAEELTRDIHALSVQAFTPVEWRARAAKTHASPECAHAPKRPTT